MGNKEDLGERIRTARLSHGMKQADLAEAVGVGKSTVGMWENGQREPNIDTLEALADVFNVPMSYFVEKEVNVHRHMTQKDADRLEALHQNPRLGLLFDRQRDMSESDIEMMLGLAERIMKERDKD